MMFEMRPKIHKQRVSMTDVGVGILGFDNAVVLGLGIGV